MSVERVDLRGAPATLLMTLYLRDRDARSAAPILGDAYAGPVTDSISYDFTRFARLRGDTATIVCRARRLDAWTGEFLTAHPDGQVLHLGCGLDSRPLRVTRPPTSRWIDVDYPEVIELRRRLYDLPAEVETIASSVADPAWWDIVSGDRPTLVLGEGLFMYMAPEEVHALVNRAERLLPPGALAFDAVAPWVVVVSRYSREFRDITARFGWSYDEAAFAARHAGLTRTDDVPIIDLVAEAVRHGWLGAAASVLGHVPPIRRSMRLLRYRF